MPTRPVECPACGHEGISRSAQRLEAEGGRAQGLVESWTCRLCSYTWTPVARTRRVVEGPDVAQPN